MTGFACSTINYRNSAVPSQLVKHKDKCYLHWPAGMEQKINSYVVSKLDLICLALNREEEFRIQCEKFPIIDSVKEQY